MDGVEGGLLLGKLTALSLLVNGTVNLPKDTL